MRALAGLLQKGASHLIKAKLNTCQLPVKDQPGSWESCGEADLVYTAPCPLRE